MMKSIMVILVGGLLIVVSSCTKDKGAIQGKVAIELCDSLNVTYSATIAPIIATNCTNPGCHVSGGPGSGHFNTYSGIKSKVDNGSFEKRVIVQGSMPPSGPLTEQEKEKIQCWLDSGAPNN